MILVVFRSLKDSLFYCGIRVTQHATCLGDIVCCDVGYMDAIATHVCMHLRWQ